MNTTPEQQRIAELEHENEYLRMLYKELDLYYGRQSITMRAAVIEHLHGEGENAAMAWLINYLYPRGELPPEGDTDAQAYFDREIAPIEKGLGECFTFLENNVHVQALRTRARARKEKVSA